MLAPARAAPHLGSFVADVTGFVAQLAAALPGRSRLERELGAAPRPFCRRCSDIHSGG